MPPSAPPALPQIHNGAAVPKPKHVLRSRLARGVCQLLVHWKGTTAASATWEDADSFIDRYPGFQLEDELLVEGGRDVMWGRHYQRRPRIQVQQPPAPSGLARIRGASMQIGMQGKLESRSLFPLLAGYVPIYWM
jgi:hypothetical protein